MTSADGPSAAQGARGTRRTDVRTRPVAYLDHAAPTDLRPPALAAMTAELAAPGNPAALHTSGRRARRVVEEARERLAAALGAGPSEVVLTDGS